MIQHSETITKLMGAMLAVQGAIDGVAKDATNPHFKRKYASLESVVDTIRPECQKNGLVVMQAPGACRDGVLTVETFIAHAESGEWLRSASELPVAKADPQGAGSAITYAERYSLMALFNLPPVDDDGNDASRHPQLSQQSRPMDAPRAVSPTPVARQLADMVYGTKNGRDLDELVADPDFKAKRLALDDTGRALVDSAGKRKRAEFAAPIGAG